MRISDWSSDVCSSDLPRPRIAHDTALSQTPPAGATGMSIGLLLVMHGKLGHHLLDTLGELMGALPLVADVLEVRRVQAHEVLIKQRRKMIERLDAGVGVLILTDA